MKRFSIQLKIGLLMVLAVALLAATGYLAYKNLSSIVSSFNVDVDPGRKLLTIREISMDLQKAENSFRMYSVTGDEKDLQPYYSVISGIDEKVSRLREECSDSPLLLLQTDTITKLIEENIYIWNELLFLNQDNRVIEYLQQLPEKLNINPQGEQEAEMGILKRVFSRSEKNRIDEQALLTDLDRIEKEDQAVREKMKQQEMQLAGTITRIREQFYDLTAKMEDEVQEILRANAYEADLLAGRTYRWLAAFLVSGVLLALLVVFTVTRYVTRSEAYRLALQRSRDEAENLAKTKEQFMANMSHEIRTPVTSIKGFTEQLLHEPLDENSLGKLKIIRSSSLHLERIINDILDFSKLQEGKMVLEQIPFSIYRTAEEVYGMFLGQALKNNTVLSYSVDPATPPVLVGDPYRLKQVMINLVSNSVKFTSGGTVRFSVAGLKMEPGKVTLAMEFTDTGIGIDEDRISSIFDDFTQEEMSTARRYGGTGLGLSIVRKLVDLQGGRIDIRSRKKEGTTVRCEIPFLAGDTDQLMEEAEPLADVPDGIVKLRVLIVDDEEYNRILFKTIFGRWGTEHTEAPDGRTALEILGRERFDLAIMDMRMPDLDGAETTERIRNELKISDSDMPVICVSAGFSGVDIERYRKSGMNAFLLKPFSEKTLAEAILGATGKGGKTRVDGSVDGAYDHESLYPGDLQSDTDT
ncbi:response regulator, partial [bacterium]|nr:response regulator [bacterium]